MKIKDMKIGTQLMLGFGAMLIFVLFLGVVSYQMNNQLFTQTKTIYDHPLKVRMAIGILNSDILSMRLGTRDLMLAKTEQEKQAALLMMESASADASKQFDILESQYLGDPNDVDEAYKAFINWKTAREENTRLALSGEVEKVKASVLSTGNVGIYRELLVAKIKIIDDFAKNKATNLFTSSVELSSQLNRELLLIVVSILLLSLIINFVLLRNIRKPMDKLTEATRRFHDGDMSARSSYQSGNEFGRLSDSFNILAEKIQVKTGLDQKVSGLANILMSEDEAKKFFQALLSTLSKLTSSQMAAVYFLSDNNNSFDYFESVGLSSRAKQSFSARLFEGEFGAALSEKRIIHISQIPDETRFSFPVVSGQFRPSEIINIPILQFNEVVAVISLASLHGFSGESLQLLQEVWLMITARINGVLAFKKSIEFLGKLDMQNKELAQQSKEMVQQADELKEYNIELEIQKKQLNESNQLKSAFLSNMSHELRTPLNSVIALSGVLNRRLKNKISEDEFSFLRIIEKNGKQLLSLINDILDLSRIEAGKEEISYSSFAIQNQISGILESLAPIAEEKGISLINHVQADLGMIVSDSTKCHHILQNIIGNAIKFTEKGSVEVSAELKNGRLNIGIKDTGIGIAKEHLPYIFDEFRQADGKSTRKFGGTGLGLAIAKKYTQMLQGTIEVRSQEGAGSVFVITFPERPSGHHSHEPELKLHEHKPIASFSNSPDKNSGAGKTLLLVEDSEPQIIQLTDILKEKGYILQVARNGKEALEAVRISIPDAMILDLMMPEADGFEVLKSIRENNDTSQIPVLILTAKHISKEELNFLKGNHIYQLIQKGDVNRNELLLHINNMIFPAVSTDRLSPDKKPPRIPTDGKAKILLIEDNEDNTTTVKALLDGKYELISDCNGLSGLEKARTIVPDLILLDISLPGIDGYTVLNEIKKLETLKETPVIALTARAMKGDREDLLRQGFDDYISKPIDSDLFEKTIQEWLNGKGIKKGEREGSVEKA